MPFFFWYMLKLLSMEIKKISQAVILAGGYGTRLKPFTDTNPKPMYPFNNKPFLEYLINQIKSFGINDIVLLLGYLPEKIMDYFGDGSNFGVNITYCITPVEYETGLRLKSGLGYYHDDFLLMYCDNYCPINFNQLVSNYYKNEALIEFSAYLNDDNYTKSNLIIDEDGKVLTYDKKRETPNLKGVDIGYAIVNKKVFDLLPDGNENFEKIIYPKLIEMNKLYANITRHRYYSVGSYERINLTEEFLSNKKYIFLDRDGTINVRAPKAKYIEKPDDFIWLPDAKEAIKKLVDNGYEIIMVTNQPGIARGNLTYDNFYAINEKMNNDLGEYKIKHIYFCPHNWDEGCDCRKPKPGMFYKAQKDLNLDLTKCFMLGDDERDMHAGGDAGCKCMLVSEYHPLMEAVDYILKLEAINDHN